jgi:drug/metabolite transporter (DMT)-like permease
MKRLFLSIGGLAAVLSLAIGLNSALAHLVAAVAALGERLRWPEIVGGLLVVAAATAAATLDERSVVGHRRRRLSRCASVVG